MHNEELLPFSKKAYIIIALSLPLRLTFTGTIAMPVLGCQAPVRLHKGIISADHAIVYMSWTATNIVHVYGAGIAIQPIGLSV